MIRAASSHLFRRVSSRAYQGGSVPTAVRHFHGTTQRDEPATAPASASASSNAAVEPEKKGWWEPIYAVPLGIAFAVPALHYEWIIINEETQLAACFITFVALIYKQFGGTIKDFLEEDGKKLLETHNRHEDALINLLQDKIDDLKSQDRIVQDAEDVKALRLATYEKLNAAGKVKPQYDFKAQIEKMLSLVEAEEVNLREKAKHALMDEATAAVTAKFLSSADLKKSSLADAIATLKGGKGPKGDVVQAAYIQFFKDKQKSAQAADAKAETAAARKSIVTKLNAVAKNEGYFFEFDAEGKPKMVGA